MRSKSCQLCPPTSSSSWGVPGSHQNHSVPFSHSAASGELKKSLFTSTYITSEKQGLAVTGGRSGRLLPWDVAAFPQRSHCPGCDKTGNYNSAAVSNLTEPSLKEFKGNLA